MSKKPKRRGKSGIVASIKVQDGDGRKIDEIKDTPLDKLQAWLDSLDEKMR